MKKIYTNVLPVFTLICSLGAWAGFPRLGFLAGCAADVSVHVPGDQFFWFVLLFPALALPLLALSWKRIGKPVGCVLVLAAFVLALFAFAAMANLYWQYHICEVPFVEISTSPHYNGPVRKP